MKTLALIIENLHVLAMLKFPKKWVKLQGQGHRVKYVGIHRKALSQKNTHMKYHNV